MSLGQGNIERNNKTATGGGGILTASNGLNTGGIGGTDVKLGGGLNEETFIGLNSNFSFTVDGINGHTNLCFDPVSGTYFFGEDTNGDLQLVTGWNWTETDQIEGRVGGTTVIRGVTSIAGIELYLGDMENTGNGTAIFINDNTKLIYTIHDIELVGIHLDFDNQIYTLGDKTFNNGTRIEINDAAQSIDITNVPTGAITNDFATLDGNQIKKIPAPVESGTYTPTASNFGSNVLSVIPDIAQYMRVGNVVTVSGKVDVEIDTPGATGSFFSLSLPVASSFSTVPQCAGTGATYQTNTASILAIEADTSNPDVAQMVIVNPSGDYSYSYHYTYLIVEPPPN